MVGQSIMGKTECVGVGEREREILRVRGTKGTREGRVRVRVRVRVRGSMKL